MWDINLGIISISVVRRMRDVLESSYENMHESIDKKNLKQYEYFRGKEKK